MKVFLFVLLTFSAMCCNLQQNYDTITYIVAIKSAGNQKYVTA